MIEIKNLSASYEDKLILDNINIKIDDNEILCILGPSGAGKTTLLKSLAGLIDYDGEIIGDIESPAYIFQEPRVVESLTVLENIKLVSKDTKRIDSLIDKLELNGVKDKYCKKISGGEKERVNIARAFAINPSIILMDEAFNSLDLGLKYRIYDEIKEILNENPCPMVMVTHDIMDGINLANHFIILNDNKIIFDFKRVNETSEEIYNQIFNILKQI
ncbi:MAG: ATP-binding cassette domain-containing protein [Acholeplasmatales bacterium]|nr:ATP-binding cassette domain-containing protein [Acholeplasmatales bacterium]